MTKAKNFKEYAQELVDKFGSDVAVARFLGYAEGSRVGLWRAGKGRASELACIKLARWNGDDPLAVLRLAGYTEMADLLQGVSKPAQGASMVALLPSLIELRDEMNDLLKKAIATEPEKVGKR